MEYLLEQVLSKDIISIRDKFAAYDAKILALIFRISIAKLCRQLWKFETCLDLSLSQCLRRRQRSRYLGNISRPRVWVQMTSLHYLISLMRELSWDSKWWSGWVWIKWINVVTQRELFVIFQKWAKAKSLLFEIGDMRPYVLGFIGTYCYTFIECLICLKAAPHETSWIERRKLI